MASSCEKLDQLVKDYLLFRGLSSTLKTLDQELKADKDKGLRVDRMMEQIWTLLAGYDLSGLREYWRYLNQRLFSRLEQRYTPSVRKLESSLLKLYVVNAHQSGRQDKVKAFFETMGPDLQSHPDFKDWFAFPFVVSPAENPVFAIYFQKQWQDTLQLSLHNFLSVVLQAMPVPTLLNVEFDARRMKTLQEENMSLKQQLMNSSSSNPNVAVKDTRSGTRSRSLHSEMNPPASPPDMVYDFSGLSNDTNSTQEKQKSTRRFPLSLTSPLSGRKKADQASQVKGKGGQVLATQGATAGQVPGGPLAQSKTTKVTEMAVFPPQNSAARETRRVSATPQPGQTVGQLTSQPGHQASQVTFSQSGGHQGSQVTTGSSLSRSMSTPRPGLSPSRQSPTLQRKQTGNGGDGVSSHAQPSRSASVPQTDSKSAKSKPPAPGRFLSESEASARPTPSSQPGIAGLRLSATSVDSESNLLFGAEQMRKKSGTDEDSDSPFLLLEDEYKEHGSSASFCRFSVAGQYVASLDGDGIVKVWMWSPQPATQATIMSKSAFLSLAWVSRSDRWLLLGNKTGTIRLFDVNESKTFREVLVQPDMPANCTRVTDLCTNPSSSQFVSATCDNCPFTFDLKTVTGRLLQWDLRTLKQERTLVVESDVCSAITSSCYSQDGRFLLTGGADGMIRIYDSTQQKAVIKWKGHSNPVHTVQFGADSSVFTMAADGKLCEWSTSKVGQLLHCLDQGPCEIAKVTPGSARGRLFSLDTENKLLLTYSGRQGIIYKVSSSGPEKLMELKPHNTPVVTVDWSPSQDTRVCLTGSTDGRVKISTLLTK